MRDYFEELRERRGLCWSKRWLVYYLYVLKYRFTRNGQLDFAKFRDVALQFPQLPPAFRTEIFSMHDFLTIEKLFLQLAEKLFKEYKFSYHKDNIDKNNLIQSSASPRAIYIASEMEEIIDARYGWRESVPLSEVREKICENLTHDIELINKINGINPIQKKLITEITAQIEQSDDFDSLEISLEESAGKLWDCLERNTAGILDELEKVGIDIKYEGDLFCFCRNLDEATEYCNDRKPNASAREKDDADVSDFYVDR